MIVTGHTEQSVHSWHSIMSKWESINTILSNIPLIIIRAQTDFCTFNLIHGVAEQELITNSSKSTIANPFLFYFFFFFEISFSSTIIFYVVSMKTSFLLFNQLYVYIPSQTKPASYIILTYTYLYN